MQILLKKYNTLTWSQPFASAFGNPEMCGVWFIWGNSGNGKSSFVMQLVRELALTGKVFYNSFEEGISLTMAENIRRANISDVAANVLIGKESVDEMEDRLLKRKAPQFIIIDSIQYAAIDIRRFKKLIDAHPEKLFIIISHAEGRSPAGRIGKAIRYHADLKIHVEGFVATSMGRYNPGGRYIIWHDRAEAYWGEELINSIIQPFTDER